MSFTGSIFNRYARRWFLISGVFELILAAIFGVFGFLDPALTFGFLLTAVVLGVTGAVLVVIGLRAGQLADDAERVMRVGLPGSAAVTGLTQTGLSLNDQPQIEMELLVSVPGLQPYAARRKEFVPLILLARITPGSTLPVRVDPADQSRVVVDWANAAGGSASDGRAGHANVGGGHGQSSRP